MTTGPADPGDNGQTGVAGAGDRRSKLRLLPLVVLVAGIAMFFVFGLDRWLSFDTLREYRGELMALVDDRPVGAALAFMAIYALATAFSVPGGAVLTVTGGFLFGIWLGTTVVVIGATTGATALFLAARTALGDTLRSRAGPAIQRMEAGFRENALNYLLVLRLVPLFPFFLVNLVPAFLGVSLPVYVLATFFGIIPGTFVYVSIGAGLGSVFDSMEAFTLAGALTPQVIVAMTGLAILAMVPVIYNRLKAGKRPCD